MPVHNVSSSMAGMHNLSFPLWDLGATLYWTSRMGERSAQVAGTPFRNGDGFMAVDFGAVDDPNMYWSPGRSKFIEYADGSEVWPESGFVENGFSQNHWPANNTSGSRGLTPESGLLQTNPSGTNNREIVELATGGPADFVTLTNSSGSPKKAKSVALGSSNHRFAVLVRRSDRAQVDANTCELILEEVGTGADRRNGDGTQYIKLNDNGWYLLTAAVDMTSNVEAGILVQNGVTLYYELPTETHTAFSIDNPDIRTPIRTDGVSTILWDEPELDIANAKFTINRGGWMGCTLVPMFPSGTSYDTSVILFYGLDSNERLRFIISSTTNRPLFIYDAVGGTVGSSLGIDVADFQQGVPLGMVVTWSYRFGSLTYTLCVNGKQVGIISAAPVNVPVVKGNGIVEVAHQGSANAATSAVQEMAIGNRGITRTQARHLSIWFKRQARHVLGKVGE